MDKNREDSIFMRVGREITGPVLFDFAAWVLREAIRRDIHTLYFLARDGYVLREIAERMAVRYSLPVTCRYLYCSRNSLRMPSYHLTGEEAYELLSLGGYCVTLDSLLSRAGLTGAQRSAVLEELALNGDPDLPLSRRELAELSGRLRRSGAYRKSVERNSRAAYPAAIGYLRQEGLLEQRNVAIVDSGWTGSIQRSLRQLLESAGFAGTVTGFYFGMYAPPKEARDGAYLTWYFNERGKLLDKVLFCNNLLECLLPAPHGTTLSYREEEGRFQPVLAQGPAGRELERIEAQLRGILTGAGERAADWRGFDEKAAGTDARRRLRRFMTRPSLEEAEAYGAIRFDDSITDADRTELAGREQTAMLDAYLLHRRILRKLGRARPVRELYWPYGAIAFLPKWKQAWYRGNIYAWELLKYWRRR